MNCPQIYNAQVWTVPLSCKVARDTRYCANAFKFEVKIPRLCWWPFIETCCLLRYQTEEKHFCKGNGTITWHQTLDWFRRRNQSAFRPSPQEIWGRLSKTMPRCDMPWFCETFLSERKQCFSLVEGMRSKWRWLPHGDIGMPIFFQVHVLFSSGSLELSVS